MNRNTKLTSEEFVARAVKVHGDRYDYSKTEYNGADKKLCIKCKIHGEFWQLPNNHLKGCNCPECAKLELKEKSRKKEEISFRTRALILNRSKYDYSKVEYKNSHEKVCIICPEHGEFWQSPNSHLNGKGCPKCGTIKFSKKKTLSKEEFLERSKKIHGNKYDYSLVKYDGCYVPVKIICPKHGIFEQKPIMHYKGYGCKECAKELMHSKFSSNKDTFIEKARKVHGDKYDYSNVNYYNGKTKVCIICPEHGEFWQTPNSHLSGHGCKKCSIEEINDACRVTYDEFIERSKKVHGTKYDYSKVNFKRVKDKVKVICPVHGEFEQEAYHHMIGCACPNCTVGTSNCEKEIVSFLKDNGLNVIEKNREIIKPYEIDIFLPDKNIGIEYNGILWHSEKYGKGKDYHYKKMILAKENSIKLIQIFEDEWIQNKNLVKEKLLHIIGINKSTKIMGRKCCVKKIPYKNGKDFLFKNHIQKDGISSVYIGAYCNDELIAVMSFKKNKQEWELTRYSGKVGFVLQGVAGKLFNFFVSEYKPNKVKTFADRRWTLNEDKNLYTTLGFKFDKYISPDYRYIFPNKCERIHKFNFRKQTLHKKYGLPLTMTESQMIKELGYYKIWDCGLIKYVWENDATC